MKAVIPAAGLGTRFLPYTRSQPKEMLPVVDKPAIQYVVEEAVESGIEEILIVTARGKRAIEDHFDRNLELEQSHPGSVPGAQEFNELLERARIFYVRQTEHRGLGHAVLITEKFVGKEPFSVLLGDDLTFSRIPCQQGLLRIHEKKGVSVLAVQHVGLEAIGRYGMVVGKEAGEEGVFLVEDIVEKPTPRQASSDLATLGRYVFTPQIFSDLRKTRPGVKGEVQLTDAIATLLKKEDVYACVFNGTRYDIGDKLGWLRANFELALDRPDLTKGMRQILGDQTAQPRH